MATSCNAEDLIEAARCFEYIPRGDLPGVKSYLLCQWANHGGAPGQLIVLPADTVISWTDDTGVHSGTNAEFNAMADFASVSQITFPDVLEIKVTVADFGALTTLDFTACTAIHTLEVNCPALTSLLFNLTIQSWFSTGGAFSVHNSLLASLALDGGDQWSSGIDLDNNPFLVSVTNRVNLDSLAAKVTAKNCALNQTTIDLFLRDCVTSEIWGSNPSTPVVDLTGGTNAQPSAAGLADKATLEGYGLVVLVN